MSADRWTRKANAYRDAYIREMGVPPSHAHHVVLALCVAQYETQCGDALGGNWGATMAGMPTPDEVALLNGAGLSPDRAGDLIAAQKELGTRAGKILWRDYSAAKGWYWAWFYKPTDEADGARYFVRVMAKQARGGPERRAALENPASTTRDLATAMYRTSYFMGVHPHDGGMGDERNIAAYAGSLEKLRPRIEKALVEWAATTYPAPPPPDPAEGLADFARAASLQAGLQHLRDPEDEPDDAA